MISFAGGESACKAVRFLTHQDTGKFKGCAFIDFFTAKDVDNFVLRNGENLMGRLIQIDYAGQGKRESSGSNNSTSDTSKKTKKTEQSQEENWDEEEYVEDDGGWGIDEEDASW